MPSDGRCSLALAQRRPRQNRRFVGELDLHGLLHRGARAAEAPRETVPEQGLQRAAREAVHLSDALPVLDGDEQRNGTGHAEGQPAERQAQGQDEHPRPIVSEADLPAARCVGPAYRQAEAAEEADPWVRVAPEPMEESEAEGVAVLAGRILE